MALKIEIPNCPECGSPASGTIERLVGCAEFERPQNGVLEYSGWTEIFWEEQRTNRDSESRTELICENRHSWFSKMEEV